MYTDQMSAQVPVSRPELTTVEYRSLPGFAVRKKLRAMDHNWSLALGISLFMAAAGMLLPILFYTQGSLFSILYVLLISATTLYLRAKDQIEIGEHGLSFPVAKAIPLRLRTLRLWSDVERVEVISSAKEDSNVKRGASAVVLVFKSGGEVRLRLTDFSKDGLCTFLSGLQQWTEAASNDRQLEHLPLLYEYESGERLSSPDFSYTKFWEIGLQNSYSFTTFVPLQTGQLLRSESLKVKEQIAAGGFSAIYLVQDLKNSVKFVLKESIIPSATDEDAARKIKEHFRREAEILLKLSHPAIARVHDHFVENGRNYLLLEYIDGDDLRCALTKRAACDERSCVRWASEVAEVLAYLHNQSPPVVHRDVTPDNLVLNSRGQVVVIDFGAANVCIGEATGTLVGKQAYMSPEQIRGKATPQSDIYSLGASMYFFLTGHDPEPLTCSDVRVRRPGVSDELAELILDCTRINAFERIAGAEQLQARLKALSAKYYERSGVGKLEAARDGSEAA